MQNTPIQRPNLAAVLVDELRRMIVDGQLPAGERINEIHLSQTLGVSRTPLREALGWLAAEGALTSRPRIGYFVCPLTLEEFEQLYAIRPILDPAALELAGIPSAERLHRLEALNQEILEARDPDAAIELDDAWHLALIDPCPNKILIELIQQFMRRTRRYETALMREQTSVRVAAQDHEGILAALRNGNLGGAIEMLRRNMQTGSKPISHWLEARPHSASKKG